MGVFQFYQIVVPNGTYKDKPIGALSREMTLVKLKNIRVCVDTPNMIYSSVLAMSHIDALTDAEGNTTSHINTIFGKILMLDAANIKQIWVFDSPIPNPLKAETTKKRNERAFSSTDPKVQFRLNEKYVNDIKTLLTHMGVPYIEAPAGVEAEQYGAWMTRGEIPSNRFCQYMISADADVLAFGGNLIRPYQKPSATGKSKRTVYQVYELHDILRETNLTYDQFLTMCVAMGTDFNQKTPMIGIKTAIEKSRSELIDLTERQKEVIKYYKSEPQRNEQDAHFSEYDEEATVQYLLSKGFQEKRLRERLAKYSLRHA